VHYKKDYRAKIYNFRHFWWILLHEETLKSLIAN